MSNTDYTVDVEVTEDITPAVDTGDATSSSLDDEQIFLSAEISPDELIDAEVNTNEMVDISVEESVGSTGTDHRLLTHRDAPEQHPMSAITGLNTSLQNMSASIDSRLTADENGIILLQVETNDHTQRLGVVEDDVVDAAKTATNYVTALSSSGIKLHAEDSASLDYIRLNGDGMEVFKGAQSVSEFGDAVRLGYEDGDHINIDSNGLEVLRDGQSMALFSDQTRIGLTDGAHLELDARGIRGVAPSGNQYFSVAEGAVDSMYTYNLIRDEYITSSSKIYYIDGLQWYQSIASDGEFRIRIDYYAKRSVYNPPYTSEGVITLYASTFHTFTKGHSSTDGNVSYSTGTGQLPNHTLTISNYPQPALPSESGYSYNFYGMKAMYGIYEQGHHPFYRFGTDTAETGGASSFVMGIGTKADYENQFACGSYNSAPTVAMLMMVGNGSSDSVRSDAMTLKRDGELRIAGTLIQASDRRLKEHINYLGEDAVGFVRQLKPAHYIKDDKHHLGFYAQDVEAADKWHCMTGEMNGFKTLGYTELIAPLVAYCQSLEQRIEELERN